MMMMPLVNAQLLHLRIPQETYDLYSHLTLKGSLFTWPEDFIIVNNNEDVLLIVPKERNKIMGDGTM
jgi:hypothetical protein